MPTSKKFTVHLVEEARDPFLPPHSVVKLKNGALPPTGALGPTRPHRVPQTTVATVDVILDPPRTTSH